MFAVITRSVRFFVAPSPLTHFSIKYPKCLLTLNTIIGVQIRVAIIKANFFPCSFQLFITCVLKKIAKAVFSPMIAKTVAAANVSTPAPIFSNFLAVSFIVLTPLKKLYFQTTDFSRMEVRKNAYKIE